MLQMTIIASLITTLAFSSAVLKILGDVEKDLPRGLKNQVTCEATTINSTPIKNFDSIEN